jgi:hypothetical protein
MLLIIVRTAVLHEGVIHLSRLGETDSFSVLAKCLTRHIQPVLANDSALFLVTIGAAVLLS